MKLPRVRLTVRRLMVFVPALLAARANLHAAGAASGPVSVFTDVAMAMIPWGVLVWAAFSAFSEGIQRATGDSPPPNPPEPE
jgi:hypothetical protein